MDQRIPYVPETVACRMHTPGKPSVRIDRWKFDAIRGAILQLFSIQKGCAVFADLVEAISQLLRPDILGKLGPIPLYATVVMLEMEASGEITRWKKSDPDPMVF